MKLARFRKDGEIEIGVVDGDSVASISARMDGIGDDMIKLIAGWDTYRADVEKVSGKNDASLSEIELLAPVQKPGKIWAIGLNYADHVEESGTPLPEHQIWFTKAQTSVAGPYQNIERPLASKALDYEAELVYIIGKGGRNIPLEKAADAIFGYCVGNDVSIRDWQLRTGQYSIGKSFDTHAPFGPWIVTADEIDATNLPIRSFVNGEKRQESNTKNLIFSSAEQMVHLSQAMTMEAGDVVYTGTPGGVGLAMKPPVYLQAGDLVRVEIDGIGYIENKVVDEKPI